MSGDIFDCHDLGVVLLTSNGWRAGVLLDRGQDNTQTAPPTLMGPKMSAVLRLRNPAPI